MENISITALEAELKSFFDKEYRKDAPFRFCLLFSQLGDLFHYLTHDSVLNPPVRSWGSKHDERGACGQALMQLLMSIVVVKLSVKDVFDETFDLPKTYSSTIDDVEKKITKVKMKNSYEFDLMGLIIEANSYVVKLEHNPQNISAAASALKFLTIYTNARGFSFKEALMMGLQNQRDRDWAKTVAKETNDNKISGIIGVPGVVCGEAYVVSNEHPLSSFPNGYILVTEHGKAEHVEAVSRALGVITDNGGRTCHMVNILFPQNIVCLVGTGFATKKIKHGQQVTIFAEDASKSGYVEY